MEGSNNTVARVPQDEMPVLEKLIALRQRLTVLKMDRTQYIKSSDVLKVYEELVEQVSELNELRMRREAHGEHNRVDVVLDDIFQLISLFFLAIGRNNSSPACYVQITMVKRLLDHLNEAGSFTENDLQTIGQRMEEMSRIIEKEREIVPPALYTLFTHKLGSCEAAFNVCKERLSRLSPELMVIQQRLVSIKRQLTGLAIKSNIRQENMEELHNLQEELKKIEALRSEDGLFVDAQGNALEGQEVCNGLLTQAYEFAQDLSVRGGVSETIMNDRALRDVYDRLFELKSQLERLMLTHRWTLRETDLYTFQTRLAEVDAIRVNGKFLDSNKNVPKDEMVLLYMLRRCYAYVYQLLSASEPVSEALTPIHNQLKTVRRCLVDVRKSGGPYNARELYPYQMKLASIDNLRVDGKFMGDNDTIPEGQGAVHALMEECYDLMAELQAECV